MEAFQGLARDQHKTIHQMTKLDPQNSHRDTMLVVRTVHATVRGAARCSCSPLGGGSSTVGNCRAKMGVGMKVACGATSP